MRALVTGASRGIGLAVARRLHAHGATVALVARASAALSAAQSELVGSVALAADLSRAGEPERVVGAAFEALGRLDAVVNCAGMVRYADAFETSNDDLRAQLELNFVAPFVICREVAKRMRDQSGGGAIVNVASTLGLRPAAQTAAYSASKAALLSMTRAFALELGRFGIRVNAVAPGLVDTDMIRELRPGQT